MSASRQVRWQQKQRAAGKCVQCGKAATGGAHCDVCVVLRREHCREQYTPVATSLCGSCRLPGHNSRTCKERWEEGGEELLAVDASPEAWARRSAAGKLDDAEVLQARLTYAEGKTTQVALAKELNVSQANMSLLLNHKIRSYVGGPKKVMHTQVIQRQQKRRFLAGIGRVKS